MIRRTSPFGKAVIPVENDELVRMSESLKSAQKRIAILEARVEDIHNLTVAVATVNTKVDDLTGSVDEIKKEVKKASERPARWWDKLIAAMIGAVGAGLAAALFEQLGR